MTPKELKLLQLLELKYQLAEARVSEAREKLREIENQIEQLTFRRNVQPNDPTDQIYHERHIGWLDQRGRELSIVAAQIAVEFDLAMDALRVEFGRRSALSKILVRRDIAMKKQSSS
jgi:hypothetical protein